MPDTSAVVSVLSILLSSPVAMFIAHIPPAGLPVAEAYTCNCVTYPKESFSFNAFQLINLFLKAKSEVDFISSILPSSKDKSASPVIVCLPIFVVRF